MISCVRFKDGVRFGSVVNGVAHDEPTPAQARIVAALDIAVRWKGHDLTVTCGREGHPATDPHTKGLALDVRAVDLTPDDTLKFCAYLSSLLSPHFTILYETPTMPVFGALKNIAYINPKATAPHFHIQVAKSVAGYPPPDDAAVKA